MSDVHRRINYPAQL